MWIDTQLKHSSLWLTIMLHVNQSMCEAQVYIAAIGGSIFYVT